MIRPVKVTFHMDAQGTCVDPHNPVMLDGLMAWCLAPFHTNGIPPDRDERPTEIPVPVASWRCDELGVWGYRASAVVPDGESRETVHYRRRKLQVDRLELTTGSPNVSIGTMKEWNVPIPIILCPRFVAYAMGNRKRIRKVVQRHVKYLGRERAHGFGRVLQIDVDYADDDFSMVRDGLATRFLPERDGTRLCRPRSPYWNNVGRVPHCNVGDQAPEWALDLTTRLK